MVIIYHLMLGKLMLVARHFASIAINLQFTAIQARKMYLSMLRNQQNTFLVRRTIYPSHSYHFIGRSLRSIHQVRLVPVLPGHVSVQCLMVQQKMSTPLQKMSNTSRPIVRVSDRKHHLENYILYFIAENSLPLSVVPKIIVFSVFVQRSKGLVSTSSESGCCFL